MVGLVFDGLERKTIFLNSNVPYLRWTVHFSFLVEVSRVVKYFLGGQKHENLFFLNVTKYYLKFLSAKNLHNNLNNIIQALIYLYRLLLVIIIFFFLALTHATSTGFFVSFRFV